MAGTYAIILEYNRNDLSQGQIWEFNLGNRRAGFRINRPEITVTSDIDNGNIRTVTITRPIIGTEYTFPNPPTSTTIPFVIDLISAIGPQSSDFVTSAPHSNRASVPIILTQVTTGTPTVNPILLPTANPLSPPSFHPTAKPIDPNKEVIQCIDEVCTGKEVQCTQNKPCLVECNSEKGCFNTTITCSPGNDCAVDGIFANSLSNANINGPIGYNLVISCDDLFSCQGTKIDASQTSTVYINCPGMKSCENIDIHCPPHNADGTTNCKITGNTVDPKVDVFTIQTSMVIHAINSWNDIDLTEYLPTIGTSNSMFCGINFVEDVCSIAINDGIWNCIETNSLCFIDYNITTPPITTNKTLTTQIPSTNCSNGDILTSSINTGIFDVIATINCTQNTITMNITYSSYVNNWFGLVFNTEMFGDAIVYTTGKENNRNAALYAYDLNGKTPANVIYNTANDWIEISKTVDITNGIQIIYQQNLFNTKWNGDTTNILFREAIGGSLKLEQHLITSGVFSLNFTASTPTPSVVPTPTPTSSTTLSPITATPTTAIPTSIFPISSTTVSSTTQTASTPIVTSITDTVQPTPNIPTDAPSVQPTATTSQIPTDSVECPYGDILTASTDTNQDLLVMVTLNCKEEVIYIDITYPGFNDNWFGLVFNNEMAGDSVVYTTGKTEDNLSNNTRLYAYDLNGRSMDAVIYNPGKDWLELSTVINNGIQVKYQQELRKTQWNKNTNMIQFRYATGRTLKLQQHTFTSDVTYVLNLTATEPQTTTTTVPQTTTTTVPQTTTTTVPQTTTTTVPQTTTTTVLDTTVSGPIVFICDENSNCSDTDIVCTVDNMINNKWLLSPQNGSCVIKCVSEKACYRTHVICLDGNDCYLDCEGDESCKQAQIRCGNDTNCYIKGYGKRALYGMDISGQIGSGEIQIECNGENACNNTLIAGRDAEKLEIICAAKQSCSDMQIQCPQFTETANCKILATTDESVADVIVIFAVNSWRDIDDSSYLPSGIVIEMFCGAMYGDECVGVTDNDQQWNCMDKISNCWEDIEETLVIKCSEDRVCNDITISCDASNPFVTDNSIPDGGCRIICDGRGSCSGSDIACSINSDNPKCEIICNGDDSCSDLETIDCGTSKQCDIECIGAKSCSNVNINCGINGEDMRCNINGMDDESLLNAQIDCLQNTHCDINCAAMDTCKDIIIYGMDSDFMNITCYNTSCNNMELYCPPISVDILDEENKKCVISGQGDKHQEFVIYARNSWNDIDLTAYTATIISLDPKTNLSSAMYCGANYTDYCIIRDPEGTNNWNCIDDESVCYIPIIPTTTTHVIDTTIETTKTTESTDTAIICNERECAGKTLECGDDVEEECEFNCLSPNACNGTTFNCKDGTLCRIKCESVGACNAAIINCGNNGNCFVDGNAENALSNTIINGGTDVTELECALNVGCNAMSSCLNAVINGEEVDELNIVCNEFDSCKDLTIRCPEYTEQNGDITKHCIINGTLADDSNTIHEEFIIYAKNSWNDIEFINYLPIININDTIKSKMYCDDDLSEFCMINNPFREKEWNCDDKESVCYVGEHIINNNMTEIRCHEIESPCNNITDLQCPNDIGCKFICDTTASCVGLNIQCLDTRKCEVECNGEGSCKGVNIYGSKDTEMNIICNGEISCQEAILYGADSSDLQIECNGYSGCNNMKIRCPVNIDNKKHCRIIKGNNDTHNELELYAINGFHDLDVSNYSGNIINTTIDGMDNNNLNVMHCGNNYEFSCQLNASLLCDCMIDEKQIDVGNEKELTRAALTGIIIACCAVFVIVLITAIYCLYYKPRHPKQYKSVSVDNDKGKQSNDIDTIPVQDDTDNETEAIQLNTTQQMAVYDEL